MRLSAEELAYVRRARIALFATLSPRGAPFVTPLWFVERSGRLCCATASTSITVRNLEARSEATLLLYPGRPEAEDRILRLRGAARARRGRLPLGVILAMAAKYYVAPAGLAVELSHAALWWLRLRYYAQASPALLEFTPESADWVAAGVGHTPPRRPH